MNPTLALSRGQTVQSAPDSAEIWRLAVARLTHATLAHGPEWYTVIRRAYGHDPLYLSVDDDAGRTGLLPAFVVRRPLFGTVVTSMPFLDAGGPCASSEPLANTLVHHLIAEAQNVGASVVDLRCTQRLNLVVPPMEHKVNMTLPLQRDPDSQWRTLDSNVRSQIRQAGRSGLSVDVGGVENLDSFYPIFASRMHELGSPVHARSFFFAVMACFGARARITLVRKGEVPVGGLLALAFKDRLIVPWASCRKEYFTLRSNMLLYWETIRNACADGFAQFDFGRSTRGSGTYRFKRQWGARETPLFWYTIPIGARRGVASALNGKSAACFAGLWQRLPHSVTQRIGPHVRKYLIQ